MNIIFQKIVAGLMIVASPLTALFQGGVATKNDIANIKVPAPIIQEAKLTPQISAYIDQYLAASKQDGLILGATLPVAGSTYTIAGSGVTSSATSITLTSLTLTQNGYEIVDADLGDIFFVTLEPGSRSKQEIASCTTVTQNANNTATLSGCTRGLSPVSPYTASSTLKFSHAGGSQVVFSDPPQLFNLYTAKANNEGITGEWTYSINPHATTATSTNQLVTLGQVNGIAIQGAATSTETSGGIVELGTLAEQASSFDGGVAKPTVLQTKNSTSTCQVVGSYNIVASTTTGRLDKGCFDQTASYTLTGSNSATRFIFTNATSTNLEVTGSLYNVFPQATSTTFLSSGTWAKPAGVSRVKVTVIGGGGGAGGVDNSGEDGSGGGGGGAFCQAIVAVTGNVTVTVGTGGAGGNTTPQNGSAGNNSVFAGGTTVTAAGGSGGALGSSNAIVAGGAGGACTNANFASTTGQTGGYGNGAGDAGGDGGNSGWGFGGRGVIITNTTDGEVGRGYGGGGGGTNGDNSVTGASGGAGSNGTVIVEWYQTTPY